MNVSPIKLAIVSFVLVCSSMSVTCLPVAQASGGQAHDDTSHSDSALTPPDFSSQAHDSARQLIEDLGPQQTFARLGWQQNPDYQPADICFEFWHGENKIRLSQSQITDCETHANDLSRLYASYDTDVDPITFKSRLYWSEKLKFDLEFPQLVESWKAAGGSEEDASFLEHPVCAATLQVNWQGSEFFYDGREHPLCRLYKLELLEAK